MAEKTQREVDFVTDDKHLAERIIQEYPESIRGGFETDKDERGKRTYCFKRVDQTTMLTFLRERGYVPIDLSRNAKA